MTSHDAIRRALRQLTGLTGSSPVIGQCVTCGRALGACNGDHGRGSLDAVSRLGALTAPREPAKPSTLSELSCSQFESFLCTPVDDAGRGGCVCAEGCEPGQEGAR